MTQKEIQEEPLHEKLRRLNQEYKGRIYKHTKSEGMYCITNITSFQCSTIDELDGALMVEYVNAEGMYFSRLFGEFFSLVEIDGELIPRFQEDKISW